MSFLLFFVGTVLVGIAVSLLLSARFSYYRTRYATGRPADKTCVITNSPNHINRSDIIELVVAVVWKHFFSVDKKEYLRICYVPGEKCFKLPSLTFQGLLDIEQNDVTLFRQALYGAGSSSGLIEKNDGVNPLFLVAMTGPAVILLLADAATPIRPLGALNTRNTFSIVDAAFCRSYESIVTSSREQKLSYRAIFGGDAAPAYRRKSGIEFSIKITVYHDYRPVLEQQLFFLQRLPKSFKPRYEADAAAEETRAHKDVPLTTPSMSMTVTPTDPKLWAASCKDYNPIHVSPALARVFGFKSVIAHGNHVAARILDKLRGNEEFDRPSSIDVRFLKPMLLPTDLGVWTSKTEGGTEFVVGKGGVTHMIGSIGVAASI